MSKTMFNHIKFVGRDLFDKDIGQRFWVDIGGGEFWMNIKDGVAGDSSFKAESVLYKQIFEFLTTEGHV